MTVSRTADAEAPPLLHRPEDAARQLGISRAQMFQLLASGEVESIKIRRLRRVPHDSLISYVERLRADQGTAA